MWNSTDKATYVDYLTQLAALCVQGYFRYGK